MSCPTKPIDGCQFQNQQFQDQQFQDRQRFDSKTILSNTDAVILAGGQATRMGGCNKLLQCFDGQCRQLDRLRINLKPQVQKLWVNSHRDSEIYQAIDAEIGIFSDLEKGFQGPMMGMHSAWLYSQRDWILFVPCDLFYIPNQLLEQFAEQIAKDQSQLCYAEIDGQALYPFCLMHRSVSEHLAQSLAQDQRSLFRLFKSLKFSVLKLTNDSAQPHSINAWAELNIRLP